ncbi:MAG: hypothetical protein LBT55_01895 [Clostridiaceae bacterium]|jgi:mannose-6-phosphate isomerase class I|nr:hypothetical protein [Clostridiaceae bacterium]
MVSNENLFLFDEDSTELREKHRSFWQNGGENISVLFHNEIIRIEKIVYHGAQEDPVVYSDNSWLTVLEGDITLEIAGERFALNKGDSRYIPRYRKIKVLSSSQPCLVLSLFF